MLSIIKILIVGGIFFVIGLLIYLSLLEAREVKDTYDSNTRTDDINWVKQEMEDEVSRIHSRRYSGFG